MNDDFAEAGQLRGEPAPEPCGHVFDGGVFQTFDFVQIGVVEEFNDRMHRAADFRMIIEPADVLIDHALDADFQLEAVAVHALAFVVSWQRGEGLGGFKSEVLGDSAFHFSFGFSFFLSAVRQAAALTEVAG